MNPDPNRERTLDRLLRVRTIQLRMSRADSARANDRLASEAALKARIAQLSATVAPSEAADEGYAFIAAALYRDRLHQSAVMADARVSAAAEGAERAAAATREARRDQNAIEKLIARAEADAALRALRELEAAPPVRKIRHDPC